MSPRRADSTQVPMPAPHRSVRRYFQERWRSFREKLTKLSPWESNRRVPNIGGFTKHEDETERHDGPRQPPSPPSQKPPSHQPPSIDTIIPISPPSQQSTDREDPQSSDGSRTIYDVIPPGTPPTMLLTSLDSCDGFEYDIVVRRVGDSPANNRRLVALVDTGTQVNVISLDHWKSLNKDHKLVLVPDGEGLRPLEADPLPVLGSVELEWQFKDGSCTFTSLFRVIQMDDYDVLLGKEAVKNHDLLLPGNDLRRQMEKDAEREKRRAARQCTD